MRETMFKEYVSRAEALHNSEGVIFAYVLGCIVVLAAMYVLGFLFVYYYCKREHRNQEIYLPLGLFCLLGATRVALDLLAVWHHYAWIISGVTFIWGLAGFWLMTDIPAAINKRQDLNDCESIRDERKKLQDVFNEIKEFRRGIGK
jgi:hypothetical protein